MANSRVLPSAVVIVTDSPGKSSTMVPRTKPPFFRRTTSLPSAFGATASGSLAAGSLAVASAEGGASAGSDTGVVSCASAREEWRAHVRTRGASFSHSRVIFGRDYRARRLRRQALIQEA